MLMKLCLNLMLEDLGYRFNLSKGSISRMFHTWIELMDRTDVRKVEVSHCLANKRCNVSNLSKSVVPP